MLGKAIREARLRKGLSQQQLAEKVGVSRKQISLVENEENVTIEFVEKLAAGLDLKEIPLRNTVLIRGETPSYSAEMVTAIETAYEALKRAYAFVQPPPGGFGSLPSPRGEIVPTNVERRQRGNLLQFGEGRTELESQPQLSEKRMSVKDLFAPGGPLQIVATGIEYVRMKVSAVIAAGEPIDYRDDDEEFDIPKFLLKPGDTIVRVSGSSMIEEDIDDGDILIVSMRPNGIAAHGELVLGHLNGGVTVKKWFYRKKTKKLVSGNPDYPTRVLSENDDFRILAVVRHIMKTPTRIT